MTLKKLEEVETFHSGGRLPYVEHVRVEDYTKYENDNFKYIYENENTDIVSIYEFKGSVAKNFLSSVLHKQKIL